MSEETICEKCEHVLQPGDWPFCPHPQSRGVMITRDEIPGGMVLENYGPEPITVHSHGERLRIMKERGLDPKEKFSPFPGTDKDPQGIPNPEAYRDLAGARSLMLRPYMKHVPFDASPEEIGEAERQLMASGMLPDTGGAIPESAPDVIVNHFSGHLTHRDAIAVASPHGDKRRQSRVGRRMHGGH